MRKNIIKNSLVCDCCEAEIVEKKEVKILIRRDGSFAYEARLLGEYCEECIDLAKKDLKEKGFGDSVLSDKYSKENNIEEEIEKMKKLKGVKEKIALDIYNLLSLEDDEFLSNIENEDIVDFLLKMKKNFKKDYETALIYKKEKEEIEKKEKENKSGFSVLDLL